MNEHGGPGPAMKIPFWDHWETALLGQILAERFLEANLCHLSALGPAMKIPFWDHWETALLGQILAEFGAEIQLTKAWKSPANRISTAAILLLNH